VEELFKIRPYDKNDESAVVQLWHDCNLVVPWNDPKRDINLKLQVNPEWFLVGHFKSTLIATVMAGYEGHRGWINYLAVHPSYRTKGFALLMMERAERLLKDSGCPKINLQVRTSNAEVVSFYEAIGYQVEDIINLGKIINHQDRS
jgi:ribosomal protein S18 acetylase RimI-like enzyme